MLYSDLKIEPMLLRVGGLEELTKDICDEDLQNMQLEHSLLEMKNDILLEASITESDLDIITDLNLMLFINSLRCLQRYNILVLLCNDVVGYNEEIMKRERSKYDQMVKRFSSLVKEESNTKGSRKIYVSQVYY